MERTIKNRNSKNSLDGEKEMILRRNLTKRLVEKNCKIKRKIKKPELLRLLKNKIKSTLG